MALQICNGPPPINMSQRAVGPTANNYWYKVEGHLKSVMHTKVMLLLLSLDIVNFIIKRVIIVGFWPPFLKNASTFQGDSNTV